MAKKKPQARRRAVSERDVVSGITASGTPAPASLPAVPTGSIARDALPAGLFSAAQALEADVSGELAELAPTFGDVLASIGDGVAQSQAALDRGVVETAQALSETQISVVTDVIQELDEDGLPVAANTELVQQDVSLINYVSPTVHEWSHVALSMDLSVGALDNETGVTFERTQRRGRVSGAGLFWGFVGFGLHSDRTDSTFVSRTSDREMDWARGQVRMDAMLRPREVQGFPRPAEVSIGPQIFFSQGSVSETVTGGVVTQRSVDLLIAVRKADGSANPNVVIEVDSGPFALSFDTTGDFTGNTSNADGQISVTLTRSIPNPRFLRPVTATITATLGSIERQTDIRL